MSIVVFIRSADDGWKLRIMDGVSNVGLGCKSELPSGAFVSQDGGIFAFLGGGLRVIM